jgi:N utilization substance protein B
VSDRQKVHEISLQVLYQIETDLGSQRIIDPIRRQKRKMLLSDGSRINVPTALDRFFENFEAPEKYRSAVHEWVDLMLKHVRDIDAEIRSSQSTWRLDRMDVIDRNIIRLAMLEKKTREDLKVAQIIANATELAHRYGGESSAQFIQGVLNTVFASTS